MCKNDPILIALAYEQEQLILATMRTMEAIVAINNVRCIQFRPRVLSDVYYITITNGSGCSSYVRSVDAWIV